MNEITLTIPYYFNNKSFNKLILKATLGFVDVLDGDRNTIFSGYTVDAIKFVNNLVNKL